MEARTAFEPGNAGVPAETAPPGGVRLSAIPLFVVLLIVGVVAPSAWANGGPVAWTGVTPIGVQGLVPDADVRLLSEDLRITLGDDFNTYRVRASYVLRNDGPGKTVHFGVPLAWAKADPGGGDVDNGATASAGRVAGRISLTLNGERLRCALAGSGAPGAIFRDVESDVPDAVYRINAWCVADLRLAPRQRATLFMEYPAELFFTDSEYSKSALTAFGDRRLLYLFHPAGYWKGKAGIVRISVDAGPYPSFKVVKAPPGMTLNGRTATWLLKDVDLRATPEMEIVFPAGLLGKRQLLMWNRAAPNNGRIPMTVTASSTRHGMGKVSYDAENVLDGKGDTAWCEGVAGGGEGQWLQFRLAPRGTGNYCRLQGIALSPGYLKSQAAYEANRKVRKIRITDCDGRRPYDFTVAPPKDFREAPVLLNMPTATERTGIFGMGTRYTYPLDYIEETSCFRLILLETETAREPDTCISEVSLVVNCN